MIRLLPVRSVLVLILMSAGFAARANDPNAGTRRMLEEVRIREIRFEQAEVRDALQFLVEASRQGGDGLNLVYFAPGPNDPVPRKVSLELRNVSLGDALNFVVDQSGMVYRLERGVVRVEPRSARRTETRFYPVDAGQFRQFQDRTQAR